MRFPVERLTPGRIVRGGNHLPADRDPAGLVAGVSLDLSLVMVLSVQMEVSPPEHTWR